MKLCSPLLLCLTAAALSAAAVASPLQMWNKMILTHHWPQTFCTMEQCHPNISYWTLHGFWPDNGMFCNSSWHFNSSEIEDLRPEMDKYWPDLLRPSSTGFWKYEWHKHGTCAARAESLNSQHKYFSKALELYHKLDLNSILKTANITPSEEPYKFSQIEEAIVKSSGVKPKIQCAFQNVNSQMLGQIEICFSPDFTLVNCEHMEKHVAVNKGELRVCDHNVPVNYPPLS